MNSYIFHSPFTCIIAGPTQSGKTTLVKNILFNNQLIISPKPSVIYYCYSAWQETYNDLKFIYPKIQFIKGIIDLELINKNQINLLILDDLMNKCDNDERILDLFTIESHHRNISVFLLTQNIFSKGKFSRTISLNTNYMIILNNPRDRSQIQYIARQMFPSNSKYLIESYEDATSERYGYLFIDLTQQTPNYYRVQSGILPNDQRIIYQEK